MLVAIALSPGCRRGDDAHAAAGPDPKRGRQAYVTYCIACHSPDPSKDGPLGPAITGSSSELLEARVLRSTYPPGYVPKRDTQVMVAIPQAAEDLDDLTAYLNAP